jgi:hypothetical protein
MALDTTGMFAECTPTMAWNAHFGDKQAYTRERYRQALTRHPFAQPSTVSNPLSQRPKRAAAKTASAA